VRSSCSTQGPTGRACPACQLADRQPRPARLQALLENVRNYPEFQRLECLAATRCTVAIRRGPRNAVAGSAERGGAARQGKRRSLPRRRMWVGSGGVQLPFETRSPRRATLACGSLSAGSSTGPGPEIPACLWIVQQPKNRQHENKGYRTRTARAPPIARPSPFEQAFHDAPSKRGPRALRCQQSTCLATRSCTAHPSNCSARATAQVSLRLSRPRHLQPPKQYIYALSSDTRPTPQPVHI